MDEIPADMDLVAAIRHVNAQGVRKPWVWVISAGPDDPFYPAGVSLSVGVHNQVGSLNWVTNSASLVPVRGTNTEWVVYHLAGMHDTPIPPHAEVPVDTVFEVLAEFLDTRVRPTKIEWQEAAPLSSIPHDHTGEPPATVIT
ncbi:Imm1 family immunity protein [Actinokineospora sp.]|uniref:Imm1 family immunity protein n=1 Tax=Actinokineospora sp. TaxID=1872133 RepID=UPI004037A73F